MDVAAAYPDDSAPYANLSLNLVALGDYEKVVDAARQAIRLRPESGSGHGQLLTAYVSLDRLDEAKSVYDQALPLHPNMEYLREQRYYIAFLQNDEAGMQQQLDWSKAKPYDHSQMLLAASLTAAYHGELSKARGLIQQADREAKAADDAEQGVLMMAVQAGIEAEFGNLDLARQEATAALQTQSTRDVKTLVAVAQAAADDTTSAQKLADELSSQFPLDTIIQSYWQPVIRGRVAIHARQPQQAITTLEVALPYDLGQPGYWSGYPIYVRGMAYLQAGEAQKAIAEFNRIVKHRGVVRNCPLGSLAHLQLARAQVAGGNASAARVSYQDFLALWKNADPDIPIYQQAKSEYARLQ